MKSPLQRPSCATQNLHHWSGLHLLQLPVVLQGFSFPPPLQISEGVKLVCILAPVWFSLCWLPLSTVEWVGVSRARSQPCTRRFPFHFVHINREWEAGQKRERQGRREKGGGGEVGATKAKRKEQRGEEEGRGGHRVVVFVWGEWMKSLSLTQETRLLSHILSLGFLSLTFNHSYSCKFASL